MQFHSRYAPNTDNFYTEDSNGCTIPWLKKNSVENQPNDCVYVPDGRLPRESRMISIGYYHPHLSRAARSIFRHGASLKRKFCLVSISILPRKYSLHLGIISYYSIYSSFALFNFGYISGTSTTRVSYCFETTHINYASSISDPRNYDVWSILFRYISAEGVIQLKTDISVTRYARGPSNIIWLCDM